MRKFNPVEYNRNQWSDKAQTKNHPPNCRDHKYCHVEYEWKE